MATLSGHFEWYGEYGNFKVTKTGDKYGYTASDYRTNYCLADGFPNGREYTIFLNKNK